MERAEILHDGIDLRSVALLTDQEYFARGMTSLLDAVGRTINAVSDRRSHDARADRASMSDYLADARPKNGKEGQQ